jgi:hypothetical protein
LLVGEPSKNYLLVKTQQGQEFEFRIEESGGSPRDETLDSFGRFSTFLGPPRRERDLDLVSKVVSTFLLPAYTVAHDNTSRRASSSL